MIAVENQFSVETIKKLITLGCDPNAQNNDGMTSLHMSLHTENKPVFEELLRHGSYPNIQDEDGESVIEAAKLLMR